MLKQGDKIKIIYSRQLLELGLCELVSREATITKVILNDKGKLKGAYLIPQSGRLKNEEWYIPAPSIETPEMKERKLTLELMNKTKL